MKKKIVLFLALLLAMSGMLFASVIQVGPTMTVDVPVNTESDQPVDFNAIDFSSYRLGADLLVNLPSFLQFQTEARGTINENLNLDSAELFASASLRFRIYFLDLTAGAGLRTDVKNADGKWLLNGKEYEDFSSVLCSSTLYYRVGMGLKFGKISLNAEATAPTESTIDSLNTVQTKSALEQLTPCLDKTQVTVALLFNFF